MKLNQNLTIIGVGKMGETLISSLLKNKVIESGQICGTTSREDSAVKIREKYVIGVGIDNQEAVIKSDIIILAVISSQLDESKLIISIAAAISTGYIEDRIGKHVPVIRAMPNTASLVNEGMTVLCPGKYVKKEHLELALKIFKSIGEVETINREELMDVVTALSGSGPAYSYMMVESLTDGGVRMGLPRELARKLAAQSVLGGAKMILETGLHPALLKDEVTTPAGVTIDGLMELEDGGFRVALIKAIDKATQKSKQISK